MKALPESNTMIKIDIDSDDLQGQYLVACVHVTQGLWQANRETGVGGHF
jgi:hypothetical protein